MAAIEFFGFLLAGSLALVYFIAAAALVRFMAPAARHERRLPISMDSGRVSARTSEK